MAQRGLGYAECRFQTIIEKLLQAFLRRYAKSEASALAPFVVDSRLPDLGAGESCVAAALRQELGIWTF